MRQPGFTVDSALYVYCREMRIQWVQDLIPKAEYMPFNQNKKNLIVCVYFRYIQPACLDTSQLWRPVLFILLL